MFCHPLWQSGPILTAKGSNQALEGKMYVLDLERKEGARKVGGVEAGWGKRGRVGGRAGGR